MVRVKHFLYTQISFFGITFVLYTAFTEKVYFCQEGSDAFIFSEVIFK